MFGPPDGWRERLALCIGAMTLARSEPEGHREEHNALYPKPLPNPNP